MCVSNFIVIMMNSLLKVNLRAAYYGYSKHAKKTVTYSGLLVMTVGRIRWENEMTTGLDTLCD